MNRNKITSLLVSFTLSLFLCVTAAYGGSENIDRKFDLLNKSTPGCAVGVRQNGQWLHEGYYGMSNIQYKRKVSKRTSFNIGSVSKHFIAALTLILEDEGKLSRSDSLKKYWPEGPAWADTITLYHLIHHTSGLPDYLNDRATRDALGMQLLSDMNIATNALYGYTTPKQFVDQKVRSFFTQLPALDFEPGTQSSYSNTGYFFLDYILEKVSGKTLRELADEKIFKPLKMKNTHLTNNSDKSIRFSATGYAAYSHLKEPKFHPIAIMLPTNGGSGIYTTLRDFGKWVDHLKNPVIAPKKVWNEFLNLNDPKYGDAMTLYPDVYYRNGLSVFNKPDGMPVYTHSGRSMDDMNSIFWYDPDKNFTVIKFCNFNEYNAKAILGDTFNTYFDHYWFYLEFGI